MAPPTIAFGEFRFDADRRMLFDGDTPVALGSKGLALLQALIAAEGEVVSKDALMEAAWPSTIVEESNLTVQIAQLRKRLGESADSERWIATVPRVGYRFVGRTLPVRSEDAAASSAAPSRALPSIAVLPFNNMSSDPEQEFFAEGLAEDLITDLSKVPGLLVIARNSSFAYKGKPLDVRQVARELGVRYVIEGSVRRAISRVRINAQIIDSADHSHLWADRFDRDLSDVFALQDEIVGQIVGAMAGALPAGKRMGSKRPRSIEAYDLFVRGRVLAMLSSDANKEALELFHGAVALDPDYAEAHAWVALSHIVAWLFWSEPMQLHLSRSIKAAKRAVTLDPNNADARAAYGYSLIFTGALEEGAAELGRALEINPNHADAWILSSELKVYRGRAAEGIADVHTAMSLNPYPPGYYYWILGYVQYAAGLYEDAVVTLSRPQTQGGGSQRLLAASLAQIGRIDEAHREAAQFMAFFPGFSVEKWANAHVVLPPQDRQRFIDGYLKAGLPM
jgi:TolB-like protein/Tfp pilus assembly protein PilF